MSFNWNISSDDDEEEEEDIEEWTKRQGFLDKKIDEEDTEDEKLQPTIQNFFSKESDEEEDGIDWEDAEEEEMLNDLQPVTIDLNRRHEGENNSDKKPKKRVRREKYRFETLPRSQQFLICNLHRSHLLVMTSRAVSASSCCATQDVLAVALSLIPEKFIIKTGPPTLNMVEDFMVWFSTWIGGSQQRRQERAAANRRAGAPRSRRTRQQGSSNEVFRFEASQLLKYAATLSVTAEEDPQLFENERMVDVPELKMALFVAMARSLGWRTRFVQAIDPVSFDLTVHHPLLTTSPSTESLPVILEWTEVHCSLPAPKRTTRGKARNLDLKRKWIHVDPIQHVVNQPQQVEESWKRKSNETSKQKVVPGYVVAVEHAVIEENDGGQCIGQFHLTDVTARYASSWIEALRQRGLVRGKKKLETTDSWWPDTVRILNRKTPKDKLKAKTQSNGKSLSSAIVLSDENDDRKPPAQENVRLPELEHHEDFDEAKELLESAKQEAIPTTKTAFRTNPLYVIPSLFGVTEVVDPKAKICGFVKGERVYLRSDVSVARPARQWPYHGRRVKDGEKPIKKVKARNRAKSPKSFRALTSYGVGKANDGSASQRAVAIENAERQAEDDAKALEKGDEEWLYAIWQTDPWSPPAVGPTDPIPMNEHRNVEKALLPPGLQHVDIRGAASVAKKLCIPYAPCLVGFEGRGGNRTPSISGIVVHDHNAALVREAMREVSQYEMLNEEEKRRKTVLKRWKRLMVGLLLKERIEREYGDDGSE